MERAHVDKVLSSYQHIGKTMFDLASSTSVEDAHGYLRYALVDMPVVPILLAFHSLFAAIAVYRLTGGRQFWLKSLVLTMFAAFGGSTLANVLCGEPAPLFTTASNYMITYVTVAWYIVNHSVPLRYILFLRPVRAIIAFGAMAAKARSIMAFVDRVAKLFPDAVVGAIILGGVAGSGGTLFVSVEKIVQNGLHTPSEFSAPGWGLKSAYLASFLYYVGTDPAGWIGQNVPFEMIRVGKDEMRFAVCVGLCTHAMLETLYGRHVNPLYFLEEVFFAVTGVQKMTQESMVSGITSSSAESVASAGEHVVERPEDRAKNGITGEGLRRRAGKGGDT